MTNVVVPNYTLTTTNDAREGVWKLSRAMKAAGWITLASSDGTTKDTSASFDSDKWNGTTGTGNSGAAATISSVSGGVATLTGLTGFASGTAGQRWITITGAATGANNGTFKILSYISATSVTIRNNSAVAGDANNGSISWSEKIPLSDTYANPGGNSVSGWICMQGPSTLKIPVLTIPSGSTVVNSLGTNQTGSSANVTSLTSIYSSNPGHAIITGLTNMTIGSVGRALTLSGCSTSANNGTYIITEYLSSTSVTISNPNAVFNDANNGSITWTEKLSPNFIRGENVIQTTSNAQGEIIGFSFDPVIGTGYMVVMPRVVGSGSGVLGWNSSDNITGISSGSVATASGTVVEYVREIVFWAGSANAQTMTGYMQCVDGYTESTLRFSTLAATAGCTATIAPGGGGTSNSFPALGSYVFAGTGGSKTDARFAITTWTGNLANAQIICVNAAYDYGKSADGTFNLAIGTTQNTSTGYIGMSLQRLDNHEDGDVDPYVMYCPASIALGTGSNSISYNALVNNRTLLTANYAAGGEAYHAGTIGTSPVLHPAFRGLRGRGNTNVLIKDGFQSFQVGLLCTSISNSSGGGMFTLNNSATVNGIAVLLQNQSDPEKVATAATNTFVAEPIYVICHHTVELGNFRRFIKGTLRWMKAVQGGAGSDTLGSLSWIQLSSTLPAFIAGPWDGTTTPTH